MQKKEQVTEPLSTPSKAMVSVPKRSTKEVDQLANFDSPVRACSKPYRVELIKTPI
jgi:hypothetical protein